MASIHSRRSLRSHLVLEFCNEPTTQAIRYGFLMTLMILGYSLYQTPAATRCPTQLFPPDTPYNILITKVANEPTAIDTGHNRLVHGLSTTHLSTNFLCLGVWCLYVRLWRRIVPRNGSCFTTSGHVKECQETEYQCFSYLCLLECFLSAG